MGKLQNLDIIICNKVLDNLILNTNKKSKKATTKYLLTSNNKKNKNKNLQIKKKRRIKINKKVNFIPGFSNSLD